MNTIIQNFEMVSHFVEETVKLEQAINMSRRSVGAKAEAKLRELGYGR